MSSKVKGRHSKAIHGGLDSAAHRGAVSVPIYQTSTFAFPTAEEGAARFAGTSSGPIYTRLGNPTIAALEECVARLEGGCGAIGTATGMAAVSTVFLALSAARGPRRRDAPAVRAFPRAAGEVLLAARRDLDVRGGGRRGGARRGDPPRDPDGVRRDARQPDARPRGPGRRGGGGAPGRRAAGRGQHVRRPAPAAADRVRRGRRAALDDEVAQRPLGRGGGDRGGARAQTPRRRHRCGALVRLHDGPAPGVAGAARHPHAGDAGRARAGERAGAGGVAGGSPGDRVAALPGSAVAPAVRAREAPDGRSGLGDRVRAARRRGGRAAPDGRREGDHPGGVARRDRVADRAPGLDDPLEGRGRRAAQAGDHAGPRAPRRRLRGPRGPRGRPRAGARRRGDRRTLRCRATRFRIRSPSVRDLLAGRCHREAAAIAGVRQRGGPDVTGRDLEIALCPVRL